MPFNDIRTCIIYDKMQPSCEPPSRLIFIARILVWVFAVFGSYRSMFNVVVLYETFGSDPNGTGSEKGRVGPEAEKEPKSHGLDE